MRRILIAVAVTAALLFAVPVLADAPAYLPVQGVLADADGTPVDGDTDIQFALYTAQTGGTTLWSETQTVPVDQGFFTVYLGDTTTLDLSLFRDNGTVWLGVKVGSDAEMDRLQVATTGFAAFAQFAGDAASLGGVAATDYLTTSSTVDWTDLTGVPAGLADGTDSDTLGALTCATGDVAGWDGAAWVCATDADTTYTAGTGLTLTGTEFAADQATIEGWARGVAYDTPTELTAVLDTVYRSSSWVPDWTDITNIPADFADGVDNDTTYTPGSGLMLTGTTFSTDASTCAAGNYSYWTGSAWACRADSDTTYTNGAGLSLTGTTFAVDGTVQRRTVAPTCPAGQYVRSLAADGTPSCYADVDTNTTYTNGNGLTLTGTVFSTNAPACAAGNYSYWTGSAWACRADVDTNTTYTNGAGLTLTGTTFAVDGTVQRRTVAPSCAAGLMIQSIAADGTPTCVAPPAQAGTLLTQFSSTINGAANNATGYINISTNYVPAVNAQAFVWTRCTYDGTAGQFLVFRAAMRSPTGTGSVTDSSTYESTTRLTTSNYWVTGDADGTFVLSAGVSYDFGFDAFYATPSGGGNNDFCTVLVQVFRR